MRKKIRKGNFRRKEKKRKKIENESGRHASIGWFPLSLSKSYSLPETKGSPVHQPFMSVSLKVINFYGRITLRDYSLWEEAFFPLWLWSCGSDLIWFLSLFQSTHILLTCFPYISYKIIIVNLWLSFPK